MSEYIYRYTLDDEILDQAYLWKLQSLDNVQMINLVISTKYKSFQINIITLKLIISYFNCSLVMVESNTENSTLDFNIVEVEMKSEIGKINEKKEKLFK